MNFDSKSVGSIYKLISKNPANAQFDWFVLGILYGHPNNAKTLEELFNNVNNITSLSRGQALPLNDTNDFLVRMVNTLITSQNKKSETKDQNNSLLSLGAQSNEKQNGMKPEVVRKSSTIDLDLSDKTGLIDDYSYKSDQDLTPTKDTARKNDKYIEEGFDDLVDSPSKKVIVKKNSPKNEAPNSNKYTRKAIEEIDLRDFYDPKQLKRHNTAEEEELSMMYIKKLQEEEDKLLEERKKNEDQKMNDVICSVCLSALLDEDFIPLEACEHMFHNTCFSEYLKAEINSRHFPIKCPSNCGQEVSQIDMVQVLDQDLVSKFYDYSIQKYVSTHADEISCCPTPNCTYAFVQDQGEDENVLSCPLCKKTYCLNCRVDYHKGMTCKEYQINNKRDENDIKFEKFVKGKKYKQCSKCKFWVEKNQGCDHMTCRCKYQFCYKCGGKYGESECVKKIREEAAARQAAVKARRAANKRRKR